MPCERNAGTPICVYPGLAGYVLMQESADAIVAFHKASCWPSASNSPQMCFPRGLFRVHPLRLERARAPVVVRGAHAPCTTHQRTAGHQLCTRVVLGSAGGGRGWRWIAVRGMRGLGPRAQPGSPTRTRRALRGEQVTDLCLRAGLPTGGNTRPRLRRPLRRHAHGRLVRWLLRSLRLPVGVAHQLRRNTVTVCWLHGHCIPCTQKPTAWRRHPRGSTRHSCAGPWRGRSVARTRRVEIPLLVYAWCWPCSCYNAMACIDLVLLPLLCSDARSCCCLHPAGGWSTTVQ